MPEVGIYDSPEINAFATGPSRSRALVAVSSGLLGRMRQYDVEGVLGHEIAHMANGDMVTMTLIQGVVNAFAMFLAWVLAMALSRGSDRDDSRGGNFVHGVDADATVPGCVHVFGHVRGETGSRAGGNSGPMPAARVTPGAST